MARPDDNTAWRRLTLQGVLLAFFAGSIALAYWVQKTHESALQVRLGETRTFRNDTFTFTLKIPSGFRAGAYPDAESPYVELVENQPAYGRPRQIRVFVQRQNLKFSAEDVAAFDMKDRQPIGPPLPITILNAPGILAEYPANFDEDMVQWPVLYAATMIPGKSVALSIQLTGVPGFVAADRDLVSQLAGSMALPDPAHPSPDVLAPVIPRNPFIGRPENQDSP